LEVREQGTLNRERGTGNGKIEFQAGKLGVNKINGQLNIEQYAW
jgi:hypothetical protein